MARENQNFDVFAGNTRVISITIYSENDTLQPLSGCSAEWIMYDPYTDSALISKTTVSGIVLNVSESVADVTLLPIDTVNIEPANWYAHELKITDTFGNESTVTTGYVRVKRSET